METKIKKRAKQRNAAERQEIIGQYRKSGMTQQAFAETHGLNYTTFCNWVANSKKMKQSRSRPEKKPRFQEVEVDRPYNYSSAIEIKFPSGIEVKIPPGCPGVSELLKILSRC